MFSWISLNRTNSTWHTAISLKYAQVRYEVKVQTSYDCNKFANLQNSTRISVNSDTAASKVSFVKTSTLSSSLYDVAPQRQIKPRKTKKYECMITRNKCFTPAIRLTRHYKQTVNTTTQNKRGKHRTFTSSPRCQRHSVLNSYWSSPSRDY